MLFLRFTFACAICLHALSAVAQTTPPSGSTPLPAGASADGLPMSSTQWRWEQVEPGHLRMTGQVELEPEGSMTKFFADEVDLFTETSRLVATGNVVFSSPEGRIAADRVEFNWSTGAGTFHQASGILSLGDTVDRAQFGNQDPDVYFYGETIEKISARRYKITRGGFTTCVQPTPRWEVTSGSVVLNLQEYAVARNTVLRVKGVPVMYLPVLYYPIQDDERATGFLLPSYGTSTLRGQSLSNAFFWAIGRSQDATFFHDWFTHTGQGMGAEYRYMSNAQSSGNVRFYRFAQHEAEFVSGGTVSVLPTSTSYQFTGALTQTLGRSIRARARLDYFSDIVTQQLYQQNVYFASRPYRLVDGGLSGSAGRLSAGVQYVRNEIFGSTTSSSIYGSTPRVTASLAPQLLFGTPIYGSLTSDYAYMPSKNVDNGVVTLDNSLGRVDIAPTLRIPLSRLTFLSVNTSASHRTTYYTRSLTDGRISSEPLLRQYLLLRSDVVGPVLARIWDTPGSAATERMKHVIEPTFTLDYITEIGNQVQVPLLSDTSDFVVGGAARFTYGLNNRMFYRARSTGDGPAGQTREFVTVGLQQTYYSNAETSRYDTTYVTSSSRPSPVDLSPVALTVRVSPTSTLDANARLEYDVTGNGLQVFTTGGSATNGPLSANVNFSRYRSTPTSATSSYVSASSTTRFLQGRVGGTYALSWDIARSYIVSQSLAASYLSQCCGFQADFQNYSFPSGAGFPIPSDRRFNLSIVLAGLGTFSNFFGAFAQR